MTSNHDQPTQTFASIGIDIGKDVFHIVGFDASGKIVLRKKFKRLALEAELAKLPQSIVGLEACLSAHFVSRTLRRLSGELRQAVHQGAKNDYNGAEAIAEAALRPNLRVVQEKTQDQLDLQALHRVRARRVSPHGDDLPDPRLSYRARDRHPNRRQLSTPVAVPHSGESGR